jgi:hypothetical protein
VLLKIVCIYYSGWYIVFPWKQYVGLFIIIFFINKTRHAGVFMDQVIMPSNVMPLLALLFLFFYFLNKIIFK